MIRKAGCVRGGLLWGGVAGALLGLHAGCESVSGGSTPAVQAVRDPVMQDIPKPQGFTLVDERSVARVSGQIRVAKVEYQGSVNRQAVKQFYEDNMKAAGFELKQTSLDAGTYELSFESATELCLVRLRKKGLSGTTVVIELGPKPSGSIDRAEPNVPLKRPS